MMLERGNTRTRLVVVGSLQLEGSYDEYKPPAKVVLEMMPTVTAAPEEATAVAAPEDQVTTETRAMLEAATGVVLIGHRTREE